MLRYGQVTHGSSAWISDCGATKAAQIAVARGLADSLAGTGVTVNSVLPAPTSSEGVGAFVTQLAESRGMDPATIEREFFATALRVDGGVVRAIV